MLTMMMTIRHQNSGCRVDIQGWECSLDRPLLHVFRSSVLLAVKTDYSGFDATGTLSGKLNGKRNLLVFMSNL